MPRNPEGIRMAVKRYDQKMTKQYHIKLNIKTDAELVEYLDRQENVQGCIKRAIRNQIRTEALKESKEI